MLGKYFSFNGKLIDKEKAGIPLDSIEFTYGFGVYESLKVRKGLLYFPDEHCERLLKSAKVIGLKTGLSAKKIKEYLENFRLSVKEDSFNIKVMLIGNKESGDIYMFASAPKYLPRKAYTQGVKVIKYPGERPFPGAKTLNMLVSYLAYKEAKSKDAYDALMVNKDGMIREGTRTNFFYTDGKTIFTAPAEEVLEGVTRSTLIKALGQEGIKVVEKTLKESDIKKYKGFFLTSTSSKVIPVSEIECKKVEIPGIVREAVKVYDAYLEKIKNS